MFCSDDKHPYDLEEGHIDDLVRRAIKKGITPLKVLRAACVNPVKHYGLDVGLLQQGDAADFIVVDNLDNFDILETYITGDKVSNKGKTLLKYQKSRVINNFNVSQKKPSDFRVPYKKGRIKIIETTEGELLTKLKLDLPKRNGDYIVSDTDKDVLKIAVVNRYQNCKPQVGFIKNFGLKKGALASSVAHDSHNIIAVGVDDKDICDAVNYVIENQGGFSATYQGNNYVLPLPIAGLLSDQDYHSVNQQYKKIYSFARELGTNLHAPYTTLSFMGLLVIPEIKISDKGLFDGTKFQLTELYEN